MHLIDSAYLYTITYTFPFHFTHPVELFASTLPLVEGICYRIFKREIKSGDVAIVQYSII